MPKELSAEKQVAGIGIAVTIVSVFNFIIMITFGALLVQQGAAPFKGIGIAALVFGCLDLLSACTGKKEELAQVIFAIINGVNGAVFLGCGIVGVTQSDNEDTAKNVGIVFIVFAVLAMLFAVGTAWLSRKVYKSEKAVAPASNNSVVPGTMGAPLQNIFWGEVPKSYARVPTAG